MLYACINIKLLFNGVNRWYVAAKGVEGGGEREGKRERPFLRWQGEKVCAIIKSRMKEKNDVARGSPYNSIHPENHHQSLIFDDVCREQEGNRG